MYSDTRVTRGFDNTKAPGVRAARCERGKGSWGGTEDAALPSMSPSVPRGAAARPEWTDL